MNTAGAVEGDAGREGEAGGDEFDAVAAGDGNIGRGEFARRGEGGLAGAGGRAHRVAAEECEDEDGGGRECRAREERWARHRSEHTDGARGGPEERGGNAGRKCCRAGGWKSSQRVGKMRN